MTDGPRRKLFITMPPEAEYLEFLFLPDPGRARLAARLALSAAEMRRRGYAVYFDGGRSGETAREAAQRLATAGAERVLLAGAAWDRTALGLLAGALEAEGVIPDRPHLAWNEGDRILPGMLSRVESLAGMDLMPGAREEDGVATARGPFLLVDPGEATPLEGIAFRREGSALRRLAGGAAGSIPARVDAIAFHDAPPFAKDLADPDLEDTLHVLRLPGTGPVKSEWIDACADLALRSGPGALRLHLDRPAFPGGRGGGASWGYRLGLDDPAFRAFIHRFVVRFLPDRLPQLNTLLGFFETGIDPVEELYGDHGLAERNAELIVNIVPDPLGTGEGEARP